MVNEMGLPDVEIRVLVEGSEVAVAAFYIEKRGHVELIVGCTDPSEAYRIAMCAEVAADAWRAADWKQVADIAEGSPPFDESGDAPSDELKGQGHDTLGGTQSIDEFPF